ncbi:carboxy methyl transferase for protein phosphatase 2A [Coemansia sp. RSA 2708]|nr:carboxy methyl transferase for protein phosphatase 2A [Coemansia sp. RSA 2708]KAJ2315119.1 carboxy methyl transferase for protein phosphatase 2A [Coemansia sp. RSA 2705]KAJ2325646.1 carboxy methyl transferase for protein phosphatase 2A [Coemansia sp. RSA 2702]KAJ2369163.1 carboxy methyl transferase for protein phosphatase 2A [Coemansia sp. RSA 2610]
MDAGASGDAVVQGTSSDAAVSRESAARLGYIDDPYIRHFVKRPQRRAPLINRGTHSRFDGVQRILRQFVAQVNSPSDSDCRRGQIVNLGAGMDTSYFLLKQLDMLPRRFFEVDFAKITARKATTICRTPQLKMLLPDDIKVAAGGAELHSAGYSLIAGDLREFATQVAPRLVELGFDVAEPTLFLSECVLIYLEPRHSDKVLDWITANVRYAGILTYEQILPDDRFGRMMIENLRARGLELRGLHAYPTLQSTSQRFLDRGWHSAVAVDLATYHEELVSEAERARLARIEFLDEWEEFRLLAQHYAFTFAFTKQSPVFDAMSIERA